MTVWHLQVDSKEYFAASERLITLVGALLHCSSDETSKNQAIHKTEIFEMKREKTLILGTNTENSSINLSLSWPRIQIPMGCSVRLRDGIPSHGLGQSCPTSIPTSRSGRLGTSSIPSIRMERDGGASRFMKKMGQPCPTRFKILILAKKGYCIWDKSNMTNNYNAM